MEAEMDWKLKHASRNHAFVQSTLWQFAHSNTNCGFIHHTRLIAFLKVTFARPSSFTWAMRGGSSSPDYSSISSKVSTRTASHTPSWVSARWCWPTLNRHKGLLSILKLTHLPWHPLTLSMSVATTQCCYRLRGQLCALQSALEVCATLLAARPHKENH